MVKRAFISQYIYIYITCTRLNIYINAYMYMHTQTHTHTHIYIYIVIHRETCFLLSELFSVARLARFPKLGSKPGWLKRQSKILPLSHEETSANEGNLNAYVSHFFVYIYPRNGYRELNSFEEPCFTLVATITYWMHHVYIYIYIYIRGAFNKFLDFFVQAFKIVVNAIWTWGHIRRIICHKIVF